VQATLANVTGDLSTRLESMNRQVGEQLRQTASQANANTSIMASSLNRCRGPSRGCKSRWAQ